ncbi:MAG: hydroxymyristoyl-ACP dehydratase, partial [Desulfobacteraceae bacterium]|nr:hydroxymyristoyl-ACP dehydratase [Desulfobacteraceae bacterium]
ETNFGFFTSDALANQVGIRNSKLITYVMPDHEIEKSESYDFKDDAPFAPDDEGISPDSGMPSKALRMIDRIDLYNMSSGLYKNGYIKASKTVNRKEWFFDAHFYQDPVCPGSLGIESFLQLIRFFTNKKWNIDPKKYALDMTMGHSHNWIYRGQIIPANKKIQVHAHIKAADENQNGYAITADGALTVDGICIYEMFDFSIAFSRIKSKTKPRIQQQESQEKK